MTEFPGLAVLVRNHRRYVEAAATAGGLVTFRSKALWRKPEHALQSSHAVHIFIACNGAGPLVEYVGNLVHVLCNPSVDDPDTERLLSFVLQETVAEGLWDDAGGAKTLYVVKNCHRLEVPIPFARIPKWSDGVPVSDEYGYSYVIVRDDPLSAQLDLLPEAVPPGEYREGTVTTVTINAYERDSAARAACLAHYGFRCAACDLLLENAYGPVAAEFIHVHHLRPLSELRSRHSVDPIRDLRPVCPNCHAVIHRCHPPLPIDELRAIVSERRCIGAGAPITRPVGAYR
jgi:hypothetical protein